MNVPAQQLPFREEPADFRSSFHWRIFRIMAEFVEGFQFLADIRNTVTFFGSARLKEDTHWYQEAQKLARMCAEHGIGMVTGGGPGIMEAGNRGAVEGGGESVGLNIQLPKEQRINPYVKRGHGFHYFFSRKIMLSYAARVYVYFPGGFGTLDEFFEIITLIQTHKIERIPVIVVGKEYWTPLLVWINNEVLGHHQMIDTDDQAIYTLVDTAEEAFEIIKTAPPRKDIDHI